MEWKSGLDKVKVEIRKDSVLQYSYVAEGQYMHAVESRRGDESAFILHRGNRYAGIVMHGYMRGAPDYHHLSDEEYLMIPDVIALDGSAERIVIVKESSLDKAKEAMRHSASVRQLLCFITWIGVEPSIFDTLVSISKGEE